MPESGLSAIDREALVTVKSAVTSSPTGSPLSVTVYPSGVTSATVKEAVTDPSAIEHVPELIGLPDSEHVESLGEKPDPSTWTELPTGADKGFTVIVRAGPLTRRVAEAESPAGLPVAVTVKGTTAPLDVTLATVMDPLNLPPDTEQT